MSQAPEPCVADIDRSAVAGGGGQPGRHLGVRGEVELLTGAVELLGYLAR